MAILIALVCFLTVASLNITYPGVYYDEAWQAPVGVFLARGSINSAYTDAWSVTIAGHKLPVMSGEYIGALKAYALGAAFYIFGCTVPALRLTMIALALLGLAFTAAFARKAFGSAAAVFGIWLIATDPSFMMLMRHDWGPQVIAFTLRMAALYFLACWWKDGGSAFRLIAACALLGLGILDKASFLWFVLALVPVGLYVYLFVRPRPRVTRSAAIGAAAAGLAGSAPFWAYNVGSGWKTFKLISPPGEPATLARILHNIPGRTDALLSLLSGRAVDGWMFGTPLQPHLGVSHTVLLPLAFIACGVLILVSILKREARHFLVLPILIAALVIQIYATPRGVWVHHWIVIYPLPHLMIGLLCAVLWNSGGSSAIIRRAGRVAAAGIALLGIGCNILVLAGYQDLIANNRGVQPWSYMIYNLADELKSKYADREIQLMDWGVYNQLMFLSGGQLHLKETFWSQDNSATAASQDAALAKSPDNVFVFVHPTEGQPDSPSRTFLLQAAAQVCMPVKTDQRFVDRAGRTVYSLITLAPAECGAVAK